MKIALLGHRGIPNTYGGFETLAQELSVRLAALNNKVICYCRTQYFKEHPTSYEGVSLVYVRTIPWKSLDTLYHTFVSALHLIFKNTASTALVVNVGNAPAALLLKVCGKKVVLCVDGLDWQRKKWGYFAKLYLQACSYLAPYAAHAVVTDAASVHTWYKSVRKVNSTMIPYGTDIEDAAGHPTILVDLKLTPKKYFLYVARLERENNPLYVVKEFVRAKSPYPLVMMGENHYNKAYVQEVQTAAGKARVIFTGALFGTAYKTLLKNSLAYIRAAEVGGASPAVIEAMGRGVCVLANDKPENKEMLGDTGIFYNFTPGALGKLFTRVNKNPREAVALGVKAQERAAKLYSWEHITMTYQELLQNVQKKAAISIPPILITGAGGMLGKELYDYFSPHYKVVATDINLTSPYIEYLDVRKFRDYERMILRVRPQYIFHLAALTNLEQCAAQRTNAFTTNAISVKYAAKLAYKYGAKLVYISSAGVFDGRKKWYTETDEPKPINIYGFTKYCGELLAKQYAPDSLILRSGWMMGGGEARDKKFVAALVKQIAEGAKTLHVVNDKFGTPTYGYDVARNLEVLLKHKASGLYHMVCGGSASRYEIACAIVKNLGYKNTIQVKPVSSPYFKTTYSAPRPRSENLVNARLNAEGLNRMQPWEHCLRQYLEREFSYARNPVARRALLSLRFQFPGTK